MLCFSCYRVSKTRWNKSILGFINSGLHNIYWEVKAPVVQTLEKGISSIKFWKISSLLMGVFLTPFATNFQVSLSRHLLSIKKKKEKLYSCFNFKIPYIDGIIKNIGHQSIIKTIEWVSWMEANVSAVKSIEHKMKECMLVNKGLGSPDIQFGIRSQQK